MKRFLKIFLVILLLLAGLNQFILGLWILFDFPTIAKMYGINFQPSLLTDYCFIATTTLLSFSLIFISVYFFMIAILVVKKNPAALTFAFIQAFLVLFMGIMIYFKIHNTGVLLADLICGIVILIPTLMLKLSSNKQ